MANQKVTMKKVKNEDNLIEVKMVLTKGKILSILHALQAHNTAVGNDVLALIRQGAKDSDGMSLLLD